MYDSKRRYVFNMGATYGSLEDLIFSVSSRTLSGPNGEDVILGNAVIVNETGYGAEPGWDAVSMGVPEPPARFIMPQRQASTRATLAERQQQQQQQARSSMSSRPPMPLPTTGAEATARASASTAMAETALPPAPAMAELAVEINRADLTQSYGFSLGESKEGAKFITGVVTGGLSDGKLRLGDSILSINGNIAADLDHSEVIAQIVSGCKLGLVLLRPSGAGSGGGGGAAVARSAPAPARAPAPAPAPVAAPEPEPEPEPSVQMPEELEWKLVDTTLPARKAAVYSILFGDASPSYWTAAYERKKYTAVTLGEWGDRESGKARTYKYTIPKKGMQGKTGIIEDQEVLVNSTPAAAVLVTTKAPDAPFGSSFQSSVQYQIFAEGGASESCRFILTGKITWLKSCSLKGTITKKVKQAIEKATRELPSMIKAHFGKE